MTGLHNQLTSYFATLLTTSAFVLALVSAGCQGTRGSGNPYPSGKTLNISRDIQTPALIIATRSTCKFCTASAPFYRSLAKVPTVWIATGEDATTNRAYLQSLGLMTSTVIRHDTAGLAALRATPTLVLIDKERRVVKSWVGKLSPAGEADVRMRLRAQGLLPPGT